MITAEATTVETTDHEDLPSCYGLYWEAVGDSVCVKCDANHGCLHRFATVELPRSKARLGVDASDVAKLASASQVKEDALTAAIAYAQANANADADADADAVKSESRLETPDTSESKLETPDASAPPPPTGDQPAKEPPRPSRARKSSRRSRHRRTPWGKHTFKERWLRERARSPAIAKLTPGCKVVREYKGITHSVQVLNGRYCYDGKEYATLYEVTKAIVGTRPAKKQRKVAGDEASRPKGKHDLCNWSAVKFLAAALKAVG